jgi:DnaJ-class molecular chaperone
MMVGHGRLWNLNGFIFRGRLVKMDKIKCRVCNGTGKTRKKVKINSRNHYDNGHYYITNTCIECDGTGIQVNHIVEDNPVMKATC